MMSDRKPSSFVSIILPTYNRAYILQKAIQSVLDQTYNNWELVIVDDGSTDNTLEVVKRFINPRIRYIKHKQNKGLAAARNTGIHNARGEYIANLDSDDIWLPTKLEKEVAVLIMAPKKVGIVYSAYDRTLLDGTIVHLPLHNNIPKEGDLHEEFLTGNLISMQMALARREVFTSVEGFDETLLALQDWDFWLRASSSWHFHHIPEVLTVGTVMRDSIANNQEKRRTSREQIFKKHENLFRTKPDIYAHHAFRLAHAFALAGDMDKGAYYMKKARETHPFFFHYLFASLLIFISRILQSRLFYKQVIRLFMRIS